jgi:hypothetical protein
MVYTEKQWKKISARSFDTEQDNATICSPHFELHRHLHPLEKYQPILVRLYGR